uniref:asparagine synthase (glutamine-hydrolyzing) n=1 Tax=Ignavibacterium album TaxID=591197 RepID=A0A832DML3_9BACT
MCGITGKYNFKYSEPIDRSVAEEMIKVITHRGPDDEGSYFNSNGNLFLGHRRLSIIDLSTGHQPLSNEDGTIWIVFNGEIYNFPELKKELISYGHKFRTHSDTEVIVHAYEQWGKESFSKLNGMYAFALWDNKEQELIITRDPFGIKPVYYFVNNNSIIFGSEIKSILTNSEVSREVDTTALYNYFTFTYVPSPYTVFKDIFKLKPGHFISIKSKSVSIKRFYYNTTQIINYKNEKEIIRQLQEHIYNAVKRQMISDVPIGAMLSGGVDSSTVATIMSQISDSPIKTFTVGFEDDFELNELKDAKFIADKIGSEHYELVVSSEDYNKLLPFSVWHMEEPVATGSILAYYMICKLAASKVKVVLTGQGADEPFAGYPRHLGEYYGKYYRAIPMPLRNFIISPLINSLKRNEQLKRAVFSLEEPITEKRFLRIYQTLQKELTKELYTQNGFDWESLTLGAIQEWQNDAAGFDDLNKLLYSDSRLSLPDNLLLYGDKMAMAVSLEARVPFLDLELMRFVESIPSKFKINGLTQKYLLKKAVSKWIPEEVIRKKKIGFATPIDTWFQNELKSEVEEKLLSEGSAIRKYLNAEVIKKMIEDHAAKREDYKRPLLSFLTFEIWHEMFIKNSNKI